MANNRGGKLILLDVHGLAYRSLYTLGDLSIEDIGTGVIFGIMSTLLHLGKKFKSNDFVFCFDSKKSIRREMYPEYKMKRSQDLSDEDRYKRKEMFFQLNLFRQKYLPQMGFKNIFLQEGYEADDLMAKICAEYVDDIVMVTSDEDMYQCLYPHVKMYKPSKNELMDTNQFSNKYGIPFWKWPWVKAYAGCSTDNVQGIAGVGEKTAIKFINNKLNPTTKTHANISSPEGLITYERNIPLVQLPLKGTESCKIEHNVLSPSGFISMCKELEFDSFREQKEDWMEFFEGYRKRRNPYGRKRVI